MKLKSTLHKYLLEIFTGFCEIYALQQFFLRGCEKFFSSLHKTPLCKKKIFGKFGKLYAILSIPAVSLFSLYAKCHN